MFRTVTARLASIISASALTLSPSVLQAQKALVYCPVGIDAAGCNAIVAAITADASRFPGGADAGYDGTQGTVDLAAADLSGYAVFVVPSLADGAGVQPYALLRNSTIAGRVKAAFMGRAAVWSGTPDVGSTNRGAKDQLIRNLAAWAREDSAGTHGPGVVALEDNSDDAATRYNWLGGISTMSLTADTTLDVYSNVQVLTATGRTILTNSAGLQIGYTNMASFGLFRGGDASGATDEATGGRTARVVLVTAAGDPSDPNIATVRTDREDYQPGDTVTVTGSGWEPGETVSLLFHEEVDPPIHPDKSLTALADSLGHVYNRQYEIDEADLGVRFTITATGETSGRTAQATFTDAKSNSVTVGAQSPNPVFVGSAATYTVTVGFNGNNNNCTTTLSASGLPAGVTPSFSPNPVTGSTTATSTLTLTTSGTTPAGTTTFTVTSTDGGTCQASGGASGSGTLVVAGKINTTTSVSSGLNPSTYGQSVTFTATVTRVSGTATPSGTVQFKDGAANLGTPQPTTGSGASVTAAFTAVGTALTAGGHSITAVYSGNATFNGSTSAILTQTVNKANQTITFGGLAAKTYGDAPITVTATASSGLTVTFTASGNCTSGGTNGATITITAAGNCTVTAHQAGDANFNAAPDVGQGFTISTRPITVTATSGQSKVYGAADPVFAYTVTSGSLVSGDAFTGALTRVAGEAVGTYAIQLGTLSAGSNYTITFVSANFAITGRPITVTADAGQTKVYGNTDPTFTYTVTSGALASGDAFTGALSRAAGEAVGTYAIQVGTLSAGTNYILTFVAANFTITARPITATADPKTKVFGDPDPALTYQITSGSLAFSDAFTGTLARAPGESVGTFAITQGTLALSANYTLTFVGANLTITTRPVTVTADPKTKVYGDADPALTYQVTSGTLAFSDAFTGALARVAGETVGGSPYAITQGTLALSANYALTFVGANFSITPRPVTVSADAKTKVYGEADPALTYQITAGNLVLSDAFTGALTRAAGENVGSYAIQQGTLALSTNYSLTYVGANLTITARPVTVTADPKSKVYGEADPALTYQITSGSLAFSDAFTGALTRAAGESVAGSPYAIQQGTLALSTNYTLTFIGADFTITPRPVTVTADAKTKVYGDADPALTYQVTSGSLAFSDAFTGTLTRVAGESVGGSPYSIQQGTLALSANYTLTFVGAALSITPRPVTVTADGKAKVYGDADPALTYQITSGSLAFSDVFTGALSRTAGEAVSGSPYAITQGTLTLGPNYTLTFVGASLTVTLRPVTVTADAKTKVYGDADPAFTYQITSGSLAFSDAFTSALTRTAGESVAGSPYAITQGTLALNANYTLTFVGSSLTITPRPVTVTADAKTKLYGDADPALTYQITSGSLAFSDGFTGALTRALGETVAGSPYAITQGTLALSADYTLTFVGADLTITPRPVTVTADAKTKVYGDADPVLTYQVTSGNLVFSDAFTGGLTRVAGETVSGGPYAIEQGTLALNGNYALTFVGASLTITPRPVTVTADAQTKVYGDADPAFTYQITSGNLVFSDGFTGALTRAAGENVGSHAIQQGTLALSSNYDLTFIGADLTITQRPVTVTADPKTKVYGESDPAFTYQITSGNLVFTDAFTGALTRVAGENVGSYAIQQGTLALSSNYSLTFVGADLSITARPITVTADPQTKVYGESDPALTYQITNGSLAFSDAFAGALGRAGGESVTGSPYAITQGTLTLGTNYTITFVGANLTITPRPVTVTADAQTKVYGNADPAFTYNITSGSLAFSDNFAGTLSRTAGEAVAGSPYAITQGSLTLGTNYTLTFVGASLTITARPITVTADAKTKVYGDADPALTYQITSGSLAFSDAFTGALARAAGETVGSSPYAIQQGTLALGDDYTLNYVGANLTITARPVTVTADTKTKVYGDADPALTYQITSGSLAFSDGFTGALTRDAGETIGGSPYAITRGTLALNDNYNLTFVAGSLTITQRPVTATADPKSKVYGEADPAFTYQITSGNLVFGDTFTGALTRAAGENVGTHAIQQGTLALSSNYALTYVGADLTITARPVTVTADAKTKVYGASDPALTYQITSGNLVFSDAFSGALTRAPGEGVGSYAIQQGTLALSTNYALTYIGANLSITPRLVTVTADAKTKVYGNADPALTYQITSGSLAFSDAFAGTLSRAAGESVAGSPFAITRGSLTLGTNYTLTFVSANLTITVRPVTVTADAKTKVYGNLDPALTYQITSGSLAFSDAFTGALTRAAGESVLGGPYAITQSTLALNANYTLTYVGANLTITTRPVTVAADAKSKIYGNADPALTYQITSGSLAFSDAFTGGLSRAPGETVLGGPYAIGKGTLALSTNYVLTFVGANFTITTRPVAVAAEPKSKIFSQPDPALTYHITSGTLVTGDAFSGALTRTAGEAVGNYPITQGTVTLGSNYSIAYTGANLTIGSWTLAGYYQPVDMPTGGMVWNTIKGGQTVPLKFQIFAGTVERTDVGAVKAFTATPTSCGTPGTEDLIEITTTGNTELRYSGGQFIQNWKTPTGANICYRTTMTAQDGSLLTAYFKTK